MDRRQKKTREAIFAAFTSLLSEKSCDRISVRDIIEAADVGRTTFYAHFETKDFLLKALCEELFDHIIDTAMGLPHRDHHPSGGDDGESVFLHLLRHLRENDRNIIELLTSRNNEIFLKYFKSGLKKLIVTQYADNGTFEKSIVPTDYLVDHISSAFVGTVDWWLSQKTEYTPEEVTGYFMAVTGHLL